MHHENRYDFILSLVQIIVGTLITLICIACGFVLFRQHVEGGAYFLGLVSGTPAAALTYQLGKSAGEKKASPPTSTQTTAQVTDTPDGSSLTVSTSAADAAPAPTASTAQTPGPLMAFSMPALVDKDGNKLP